MLDLGLTEVFASGTRTGSPVDILFVCTGNIARSPLAEQLLRDRAAALDVRVSSAGTYGKVGEPMTRKAAKLAAALGVDRDQVRHHRGRWLTEFHLSGTDLVLTMSRAHSARVTGLAPGLAPSVFTVREFARHASAIDDAGFAAAADAAGADAHARARAALRLVSQRREAAGDAPSPFDDVVDPYRGSWMTYHRSAAQLLPGVEQTSRVLHLALAC